MSHGALEIAVNGETKVVGLFGDPVSHSLSPAMHNAAFRAVGLNYCYLPFRVLRKDLGPAMQAVVSLEMQGVNITAPHKEAVRRYLDELSPEAHFLEAVNTVKNIEGRLYGYNTDVDGFVFLLQKNFGRDAFKGRKACLLGAGGAARAVSLALARIGVCSLLIVNRTVARAEALAVLLRRGGVFQIGEVRVLGLGENVFPEDLAEISLLVNATSGDPVEHGFLSEGSWPECRAAIDLRYSPPQTAFMRWAETRGIFSINGLDMLLGQGLKAFAIFTGEKAPPEIMRQALLQQNHHNPTGTNMDENGQV